MPKQNIAKQFNENEAWLQAQVIIDNDPLLNDEFIKLKMYSDRRDFIQVIVDDLRDKYEATLAKFGKHSAVYTTADRVLTNQDVEAVFVSDNNSEVLAYNDGKQIVFNTAMLPTQDYDSDDFLISLHGLNHHEVAHLLWTPRAGSGFMKHLIEHKLLSAFNVLEDNRIETFMTQRYPSTIPFFLTSATNNIINHPSNAEKLEGLYPLVCGRPYLPSEVLQELAVLFTSVAGVEMTQKVTSIVNKYRQLILPRDEAEGIELITEFAQLLHLQDPDNDKQGEGEGEGLQDESGDDDNAPTGHAVCGTCHDRAPMKSGRPEPASKQQDLINKDNIKVDTSSESLTKQDSDKDSNQDSDKSGNAKGNKADFDSNVESKVDNKTDKTRINDLLKSHIAKPETQESIERELRNLRNTLRNASKHQHSIPKWSVKNVATVTNTMRQSAQRFASEIIQAEIDSDPNWNKEQPSGKLNIKRAMNLDINNIGTVFDRWEFTDKGTDIEACILIDNSGSMGGLMHHACQSTWVIKRAIESINGKVSAFTFTTTSKRLYDSEDKASATEYREVPAQASTNPIDALIEAQRVFSNSNATNKIAFILTDGYWDNSSRCNELVLQLKQDGVLVVGVYFGMPTVWDTRDNGESYKRDVKPTDKEYNDYAHYADVFCAISDITKLVNVAKDVVTATLLHQELV